MKEASTRKSRSTASRLPKLPSASRSLWIATSRYPTFKPLRGDVSVDVAIIGAGITGLTAAAILKAAGKTVTVIEAQKVAQGVTGYTTAHLTEVIDSSFSTLISHFGEDGARKAVQGTRASLEKIASFVKERRISCGFQRVPGFYYTENDEGVRDIEEEFDAARKLDLNVSLTKDVPLPFNVKSGLRFENQARFHPREYLRSLLETIPSGGSHVFEGTRVLDVDDGTPCTITTERGVVTAGDVIMATHVPLNKFFLQTKLAHYRSYVLACRIEGDVPDALFWDDEDPYHYIRRHDGPDESLLIVGGADHKVGQEEDTVGCFEALMKYASERFKVKSIPYRWSAQVAEPVDGLAYLGKNSLSSHVYVGTGYSGTGMTFGTLAAMICSDLILERENEWAHLFDATRVKPLASAKEYVTENVDFPAHLVGDRLKKSEGDSYRDVKAGEGKVVDIDGKKQAVYRDPKGVVHALDPVCTHMGCIVNFNDAEKSWDCPCHGSRFDPEGNVINGPAAKALAPA